MSQDTTAFLDLAHWGRNQLIFVILLSVMTLIDNYHELVYVTIETNDTQCVNLTSTNTSVPFIPNLKPECYGGDIDMTEANGFQFQSKSVLFPVEASVVHQRLRMEV